ncbi:hypothetical protein HOC32_04870 [Candidatus Woesearchaeota archaeon]|jgi:glutamate/tyrosine decarboxylase-like PLP-dependent enzyme|nr:hypothetical protein [Candidatus Woesearchaeota archaeon]
MGREEDFRPRGERFFRLPDKKVSVATLQREFEAAKDRFPVVYGDEQFAKPGTLPDPIALQWAFELIRTRNPNLVEPTMFIGAWEIEREAISMMANLFNHPNFGKEDYNPQNDAVLGWFTDGGSTSILQAGWTFRNGYFRQKQLEMDSDFNPHLKSGIIRKEGLLGLVKHGYLNPDKPPVVLAPIDMHFAGDKSIDILGLGTENIYRYDLNPDFTTNYGALEEAVKGILADDREIMFAFASAGSVDTGRVEDVEEFSNTLRKAGCDAPIIVDSAQQFMMLSLLPENYPQWDFRVEGVKAIVADPHKTDMSTYPGSLVMFREKNVAKDTRNVSGYLHLDDQVDYDMKRTWNLMPSLHTSRSPIGAVSTWVHLLLNGKDKLTKKYQGILDNTKRIAEYVSGSDNFGLVMDPQTGIIPLHVKGFDDKKAHEIYQKFEESRENPRFYISEADCIRLHTFEDSQRYYTDKLKNPGKKVNGFGGLYIQVMSHTTPELVEQLIERLDRYGKEVMGEK